MESPWHAPSIDPVLIHIGGPLQIRWYSLLYVGGFLVGQMIARRLANESRFQITKAGAEELPLPLLMGAVLGARIFYCLFYDLNGFLSDPFYFFKVYNGGLSFHGGAVGVMAGGWWFCRKHSIRFLNMADLIVVCGAPGLGMGRLGNFINGELWGRVTTVPWAMIFPNGGPLPRHPSQLYELFLEGICLSLLLWNLRNRLTKDGQLLVVGIVGYAVGRFVIEFFREPDAQLGYLTFGLTMGQWLCAAMLVVGLVLGVYVSRRPAAEAAVDKPNRKKKRIAG